MEEEELLCGILILILENNGACARASYSCAWIDGSISGGGSDGSPTAEEEEEEDVALTEATMPTTTRIRRTSAR